MQIRRVRVAFKPEGFQRVTNPGVAVTAATFYEPGSYVLRAIAFDGMFQTAEKITVTVGAATRQP